MPDPAAAAAVLQPVIAGIGAAEILLAWRWQRSGKIVTRVPGPTSLTMAVLPAEAEGMKRIVILGGGTGGTLLANRLRRAYRPEAADIVVVDRDDAHVYQPGLLFVPFGLADVQRITRPRGRQLLTASPTARPRSTTLTSRTTGCTSGTGTRWTTTS